MGKVKTVPTCLGHYDRGDDVCDGDPEGSTDEEKMICAWRDRCGGFKAHLDASGETVDKYVTFVDDDTATVPNRDTFAAFCQNKAEAFNVVDGLPQEPEPDDEDDEDFSDLEDEDDEENEVEVEEEEDDEEPDDEEPDDEAPDDDEEPDDDDEEEEPDASTDDDVDAGAPENGEAADEDDNDLDQLDDDDSGDEDVVSDNDDDGEGDDAEEDIAREASKVDKSTRGKTRRTTVAKKTKKKTKKKAKKRKSTADTKPRGERETNSKWAAQQRRESLALYKHFEEALSEGLNGYAFTEPKQAALPGQLYVADRRELSGYVSVYCKTAGGRDIPVVSIKMKPRATEIDVDLPVTVKMLRSRLSKAKLAKLDLKQLKGGRFRARIVGLDKEKAAIVAEVVHELVKSKAIDLPLPKWA
jgi:hypothetical protein